MRAWEIGEGEERRWEDGIVRLGVRPWVSRVLGFQLSEDKRSRCEGLRKDGVGGIRKEMRQRRFCEWCC